MLIRSPDDPQLEFEWIQMRGRALHHLDELFAGACDGMTYEEIEEQFPEEWHRRAVDKLAYRYPRGESYLDVIARLEPIIIEMERHQEPLLVIAHQGILRIIYAFYMGYSRAEAPYLSIPLNTVVELTPQAFHCLEQRHVLFRPKASKVDGQDEPITSGKGSEIKDTKEAHGSDLANLSLSPQIVSGEISAAQTAITTSDSVRSISVDNASGDKGAHISPGKKHMYSVDDPPSH
jgi:hypothetical protein